MSENNSAKTASKVEKAPVAKETKNNKVGKTDVVSARDSAPKVSKVKWTLERCKRYARRYPTEGVWASAASASYKAACAHGWKDECVMQMGHQSQPNYKKAA